MKEEDFALQILEQVDNSNGIIICKTQKQANKIHKIAKMHGYKHIIAITSKTYESVREIHKDKQVYIYNGVLK